MFLSIKSYLRVRIALAGVMAVIFAFAPLFSIQTKAAIPQTINYQSRLLTPGGLPVTSTTAIQLSFYLHPTNGAPGDAPAQAGPLVWKEVYDQGSGACSMITPDAKGYFFLKLGSCTPFPSYLDFSEVMYVGVKIGADAEASPRVQLSSHPYALNAYRLNGFEATTTATANQLLALDSNLNFNIATGTFTGAGLFINGTSTLQQVTFTVATGTSLNLTQYLAIGAIRLDATGTNNQTSGAYLVGVFDEFTNSNATTVQAALFDLDTAITTVSSTLYAMDLQQVTDNGATTTNRIQFAGATSVGDIIPGAHDTYTLGNSDLRWSELWSGIVHVGTSTWDLAQADNGAFTISGNAGSERMRILADGKVGIGLRAPEQMLSVRDTLLVGQYEGIIPPGGKSANFILRATDGFSPGIQGSAYTSFQRDATDIARFGITPNNSINFDHWDGSAWLSRMVISSIGFVGVGTNAPSTLLHVQGGANGAALLTLDSEDGNAMGMDAGIIINSDNINGSDAAYLIFKNNGVQSAKFLGGTSGSGFDLAASTTFGINQDGFVRLHMTDMGNFGFATDTPAYRLDVAGDARLTSQFMLGRYAVNPITGNQAGSMIYNTADLVPYYWDGTQWIAFATGTVADQVTLDLAYDGGGFGAGKFIITDAGPIEITNTTGTLGFMSVTHSTDAEGLWVNNLGNGSAFSARNMGSGSGFYSRNQGTGYGARLDNNTSNGIGLYVDNPNDGVGLRLDNAGANFGAWIENTGTGYGMQIRSLSPLGTGLYIRQNAGYGMLLNNNTGNRGIEINNNATGTGLFVYNMSSEPGIEMYDVGGKTGLLIDKPLNGGNAVEINTDDGARAYYNIHNGTAEAFWMRNIGSGPSLWIEDEASDFSPFVLNSAGQLGIGTSAPATLLHVQGGLNGRAVLVLDSDDGNADGQDAGIYINSDHANGSDAAFIEFANNGVVTGKTFSSPFDAGFMVNGNVPYRIYTNSNERITVAGDGNVGISTSTPAYRLDVVGDSRLSGQFMLGRYVSLPVNGYQAGSLVYKTPSSTIHYWDGTQWRTLATAEDVRSSLWDEDHDTGVQVEESADEDYIRFDTAGVERMYIRNDGYVGIGTDNPLVSLLMVGPGSHEASSFSVAGISGMLNIANFRDENGENVFRAGGSVAGNDLVVGFGDLDYGGIGTSIQVNYGANAIELSHSELRLMDQFGGEYVGFIAPTALTGNTIWTLPSSDGTNNQVLITDGAGTLSWATSSDLVYNIYNSDGLIPEDRDVTIADGYELRFVDQSNPANFLYFQPDYNANGNLRIGAVNNDEGNTNHYLEFMDNFKMVSQHGIEIDASTSQVDLYGNNAVLHIGADNQFYDFRAAGSRYGLRYEDDYSADFVARSLVDKEYVDNAIIAGNYNLYNTDGTLTSNRTVDGDAYGLVFSDFSYINNLTTYFYVDTLLGTWLEMDNSQTTLGAQAGKFVLNDTQGIWQDNRLAGDRRGVEYLEDYSADYSDRSLVDKAYVDNYLSASAGSGLTWDALNNEIDLGGALTSNATINYGVFDFRIQNANNFQLFNNTNYANYYSDGVDFTNLLQNKNDIQFSGSAGFAGATYEFDYSANYTDRSLVDKEYVDNAIVSATTTLQAAYDAGGSALGRQIYTLNNANPVEILNPGTDPWETGLALTNAVNGGGLAIQTMEQFGDLGARMYFTSNTSDPENGSGAYMNWNNNTESFEFGYQRSGTRDSTFYIDYSQMALQIPGSASQGAFSILATNYNVPILQLRNGGASEFTNNIKMSVGTSTPEAKVTAYSGSMYYRTDGTGSGQQVYVKTTDVGNTGWVALAGVDSNHWQKNTNVLSPTDSAVYQIGLTNNSASTLTGFKAVNTNDASNYAGAVLELKGSGADFTNNIYFGKYGSNFYVPSWAGNGVLATDKNLVIGSVGTGTLIRFQVGGGYTAPTSRMTLDTDSLDLLAGVSLNVGGNTVLGDATSDTITFTARANSSLLPATTNLYSLGSTTNRWSDLWAGTVHVGTSTWDLAQAANGALTIGQNGGSERMRVTTDGYVAIGTTTASDWLTVYGSQNFASKGITIENNPTVAGASALFLRRNGYNALLSYTGPGQQLDVSTQGGSGSPISISANGNGGLYISSSGDVGVGLVPSGFKMQIAGNTGPTAANSYDLGSVAMPWRNIYASGTIYGNVVGYINPGYTEGSVIFQGASSLQQDNANFHWDEANNRLLLGSNATTSAIGRKLDVTSSVSAGQSLVYLRNASGGGGGRTLHVRTEAGNSNEAVLIDNRGTGAGLSILNGGAGNVYGLLVDSGRVGFGTSTPAFNLDLVGDARVSAQLMLGQYALNPVSGSQAGAMIYNTASSTPFFWNGGDWVALAGSGAEAGSLWDADHDTGIQVEESTDEDIIRFDTTGTEYFTMQGPRLSVLNSGNSVFFGQNAGRVDNLSNRQNVYVGTSAGYNSATGLYNVAMGYQALYNHAAPNNTTAIGHSAGRNYSGAFGSTMIGYYAGYQSSGNNNVMIGYESGMENTGSDNFFMGRGTGWYNTGNNNIMMGYYTGYDARGSNNIFFGTNAGYENRGSDNIFLGVSAGSRSLGNDNIFLGYQAGVANATGTRNVFLGRQAGYSNVLGNGNIFLGYQAGYSETNSNRLYIDNSNTATPLVYGEFDTNVLRINGALQINNPSSTGYALPTTDGNSGQILITNGAGNVSWVSSSVLGADTFQDVTDRGATTTNWIQFAGATSTGDIIPGTHDAYSLGKTDLRWSDIWATNVHIGTSTWDLIQAPDGAFTILNEGDEYFRLQTNGRFAIGTSQPEQLFTLSGGDMLIGQFDGTIIPSGGYSRQMIIRATDGALPGIQGTAYTTYQRNGVDIVQMGLDTSNNMAFSHYSGSWVRDMVISTAGNVGIGNTVPSRRLDVLGSTTPGDNLFRLAGGANGAFLSMYASTTDDRNMVIEVQRNLQFYSQANAVMSLNNDGSVGFGTDSIDARINAEQSAGIVAAFNRTNDDGTIVSLRQDGVEEGTISVSGNTISYNAFTGSHYAWTDEAMEKGLLVTLTGENRYLNGNTASEIIYGVTKSSVVNDSKVIGAYLSLQEPSKSHSNKNPHLIMAVGNGEVWVADKGENINIGDYLISSDVAGHAEKDTGEFMISHIVARAAESVDWTQISESIDGIKHRKISVFFEVFDKNNIQGSLAGTSLQGGENNVEADELVVAETVFEGNVTVKNHVTFSEDTVGQAMILVGDKRVSIKFAQEYATLPIVTVTPANKVTTPYWVENASVTGFDIVLDNVQYADLVFNWHAFGNNGGKVYVSNGTTMEIITNDMGASELETDLTASGQVNEAPEEIIEDEVVTEEVQIEVVEEEVVEEPTPEVSEEVIEEVVPETQNETEVVEPTSGEEEVATEIE